jgi:hypothetical protein
MAGTEMTIGTIAVLFISGDPIEATAFRMITTIDYLYVRMYQMYQHESAKSSQWQKDQRTNVVAHRREKLGKGEWI